MPVDSFAKRMAVAGVPGFWLGPNVFPGETGTVLGRAAAVWNYSPSTPIPPIPGTALRDRTTLGTKESLSATLDPVIGGPFGW